MEPVNIIWEQLISMAHDFWATLPQMVIALVIILLTWLAAKIVRMVLARVMSKLRLRRELKNLFELLASIGVWLLGLMIAAVVIFPDLTPASLLAGLGIGSIAIGLAFKDIFENFLAGIIILSRREMHIGDFIECEGMEGKVEAILVRETHIRQTDGQLVVAPNAMLFKNPLTILTDIKERRTTIICGVAYGEDVDRCREVLRKAVEGCSSVIQENRPIQIFAQEFAESSINFEVTWWTGSKPVDIRTSRDEVISAVKRSLDAEGIEIPFPYRTLTFKESLRLERPLREEAEDAPKLESS